MKEEERNLIRSIFSPSYQDSDFRHVNRGQGGMRNYYGCTPRCTDRNPDRAASIYNNLGLRIVGKK